MVISWDLLDNTKVRSENCLSAVVLVNYQCVGHKCCRVGGTFWVVSEARVRELPAFPFPGSKQLAGLQVALTSLEFKEESHHHWPGLHTQIKGMRTGINPKAVACM